MVPYARLAAMLAVLVALAVFANSCRCSPPAIDPVLASYVPADTVVLAGFNLDRLRATSLYQSVPPTARAAVQALRDASYLLVAPNAPDLLFLARGKFRR